MTDKEMLLKIIQKAINGGLKKEYIGVIESLDDDWLLKWNEVINSILIPVNSYYSIIFSPEFGKAFFGEEFVCEFCGHEVTACGQYGYFDKKDLYCVNQNCVLGWRKSLNVNIDAWKYHLQQMVLEENPLKYLEKFLKKGEKNDKRGNI